MLGGYRANRLEFDPLKSADAFVREAIKRRLEGRRRHDGPIFEIKRVPSQTKRQT
jgi:hypothetical protein